MTAALARDPRQWAANARVAHESLRGQVDGQRLVVGEPCRIGVALADLRDGPAGRRERQLQYGAQFLVLERTGGMAFGFARHDGYVGYLPEADLGADQPASHWVSAPASHLYAAPDIKRPEVVALSLGARLCVVAEVNERFVQTDQGLYALRPHLSPLGQWAADPVAVALEFVGTPYLWAGNSRNGIDCSGLVQAAHLACGIACPGDSDQQQAALGAALPEAEPLRRGDLLFWAGHVALCISGTDLVHAAGYFMQVRIEPIATVVARNIALGAGPVTGRRRLAPT